MEKNILNRRYRKDSNIVSRRIADEVILVPIRQNVGDLESVYTLNEVAARIWDLLDGKREVMAIRDTIVHEFKVSNEEAEEDIIKFISQLEKMGGVITS